MAAVNFAGVPGSAGPLPGDADNDNAVAGSDLLSVTNNFGNTGAPDGLLLGDADDDGAVAGSDLLSVTNNFGNTGGGGGNIFAFEDAANWAAGTGELAPPGSDSIWFAENNEEDIVLILNDERSGENGTEKMGTFAFGGESGANDFNSKFSFVIRNSVTLTAQEWNDGVPSEPGKRSLRLGRENINPIGSGAGGTTETAPWAIIQHEAGTLKYDEGLGNGMDFSRDKPNSAGSLYEISGTAELSINGPIRFGDRDNGGTRTTPGGIFRVRGSDATVNVEDFINESRLGLWDHDNDHATGLTRMGLGKFVTEFVLDAGGASPVNVNDELRLGRDETLDGNVEVGYAFLRMKMSEPTTAGSGDLASDPANGIVLFNFGRVTGGGDLATLFGGEIGEGRFFDPDREGPGTGADLPHDALFDGQLVTTEYAGATYQWKINYFEGDGVAPDASLDNTIVLSELSITGTPGDLLQDGTLGTEDRDALIAAIAAPPSIDIATAQNLFDLNADEVIDDADLAAFDTHFPIPGASLESAQVPEPSSIALAVLAGIGLVAIRKR